MQRDVVSSASDADIDHLIEWTDSFACNSPQSNEIRSHLKRFVNVQLSLLSEDGLKSCMKLVDLGCLRATTNLAWLKNVPEAEFFLAGISSVIQQGLTITESITDSALQNIIKVLHRRFSQRLARPTVLTDLAIIFSHACVDRS
jgi:hypothetical protein